MRNGHFSAHSKSYRSKKKTKQTKKHVYVSAFKALILSVYCKINTILPVTLHYIKKVAECSRALCPVSTLTGVVLTSGAKYEELATIHSLCWAVEVEEGSASVCVRERCEEREVRGQGGRRGELHKTALVCKERERERQVDSSGS